MLCSDFQNIKLPALAFGCMRLPLDDKEEIDENQVEQMVKTAFSHGVNYFDTAYGYHKGQSEIVIGRVLDKYPRESYYLATKYPSYDRNNLKGGDQMREIFERQLEKTHKTYFDFYLFHNVNEMNIGDYLDESLGIVDYFVKQKKLGRIRHLGFSCHGQYETLVKFVEKYGEHLEFCQIQFNYLDARLQEGLKKVEYLNSKNIPIWVMEPVRGGKLAKLDDKYEKILKSMRPDESVASWAFRYLLSVKGVTTILSGMSNIEQLNDNIKTFENDRPLSGEELSALNGIVDDMLKGNILPCVGCRYCTEKCPMDLDIPKLLTLYNEFKYSGGQSWTARMVVSNYPDNKKPSACLGCHGCESVCPQNLKIADALADFNEMLNKK